MRAWYRSSIVSLPQSSTKSRWKRLDEDSDVAPSTSMESAKSGKSSTRDSRSAPSATQSGSIVSITRARSAMVVDLASRTRPMILATHTSLPWGGESWPPDFAPLDLYQTFVFEDPQRLAQRWCTDLELVEQVLLLGKFAAIGDVAAKNLLSEFAGEQLRESSGAIVAPGLLHDPRHPPAPRGGSSRQARNRSGRKTPRRSVRPPVRPATHPIHDRSFASGPAIPPPLLRAPCLSSTTHHDGLAGDEAGSIGKPEEAIAYHDVVRLSVTPQRRQGDLGRNCSSYFSGT